jgi:hypothetical protein
MNKVQIKPTETGAIINTYKNNPAYGYITLQSEEMSVEGGWVRNKVRSALLRAETALLEKFVQVYGKGGNIPGRIVVKEFVESELPQNYVSRLNKNLDYEESIAPYVKRAGKDGIELTLGGERILRFTDYDGSGAELDVRVAHDNVEAIVEARANVTATGAALPA